MIVRTLITILLVALSPLWLAGCDRQDTASLRIATNVWPGYGPLYLARSLGEYDEGRVQMVELPNSTESLRAYRNGVIDGAALTLDEVLLLAQQHQDFSIVLITDFSHGADVIVARPPIDAMEGIRGNRVGVENSALGAYMLSRALDKAGIPPDAITVVPLPIDEHTQAYESGRVDVLVTFEPVRSRLLGRGAVQIFDSSQIPKEIVDVVIVRNSFLEKHPEPVRILLHGWFAALDRIEQAPQQAFATIAKRMGLTPEETEHTFDHLLVPDVAGNRQQLFGPSPPMAATAERLTERMLAADILNKSTPPRNILPPAEVAELYP